MPHPLTRPLALALALALLLGASSSAPAEPTQIAIEWAPGKAYHFESIYISALEGENDGDRLLLKSRTRAQMVMEIRETPDGDGTTFSFSLTDIETEGSSDGEEFKVAAGSDEAAEMVAIIGATGTIDSGGRIKVQSVPGADRATIRTWVGGWLDLLKGFSSMMEEEPKRVGDSWDWTFQQETAGDAQITNSKLRLEAVEERHGRPVARIVFNGETRSADQEKLLTERGELGGESGGTIIVDIDRRAIIEVHDNENGTAKIGELLLRSSASTSHTLTAVKSLRD